MPPAEFPVSRWPDWDPRRLARDLAEVREFAPELEYLPPTEDGLRNGGWRGLLPLWPFARPEPEAVRDVIGAPLQVVVVYSSAHPVIAPDVYAVDPEPGLLEESNAAWHVAPGGALCLLQSEGGWIPEASVVDLLLKACGWHLEYALMQARAITRMTVNGIVTDASLDAMFARAARSKGGGS
ncbi:hypothetical protein [Plantibacter sp. YIM 135249]|uniref:hypothetical protein n=1 Tax=Plantibacter sp. YIM 135249 TaxID=3423918 RepID=UPI003D347635